MAVKPVYRESRVLDLSWVLAWVFASSVWCLTAAGRLGATSDEPFYIAKGLEFWRTGSHGALLKKGTMPVPMDLVTLPVYVWERWQGIPSPRDREGGRLRSTAGMLVEND